MLVVLRFVFLSSKEDGRKASTDKTFKKSGSFVCALMEF